MTDQDPSGDDRTADVSSEITLTSPVTATYKVLGQFDADGGVGVLGQNDADSGTPIGVQGAVPNNATGFGLATPDDARVEGAIEATSDHALTVGGSRALRLGPTGTDSDGYTAGGNVIGGYEGNFTDDAVGATIGGGGNDGFPNKVYDDYGTVGGGFNNQAGQATSERIQAVKATVGGGSGNRATGESSTVGGGFGNEATGGEATVGGGESNSARGDWATVAGGAANDARGGDSAIGGGSDNDAFGSFSTIAGGNRNQTGTSGTNEGRYASVGGGTSNYATGNEATICGGSGNTASDSNATIGGGLGNTAGSGGAYATIGGGTSNFVKGEVATVGGGESNTAASGAVYGAVGGGTSNYVSGEAATIGGGYGNEAGGVLFGGSNQDHTVAGGRNNRAIDEGATIGGGRNNKADGLFATIPGGVDNRGQADYTFAAGRRAKARDAGAFVWADKKDANFESDQSGTSGSPTGTNTFHVRARGGVRFVTGLDSNDDPNAGAYLDGGGSQWKAVSTRSAKHDVRPVDPRSVLAGVESLEVSRWAYDADPGTDRMGPMAEEFHDAFGLGDDPETIGHVDADGVALAAIQGLSERLDDAREELDEKDERIAALEDRLAALESRVDVDAAPTDD